MSLHITSCINQETNFKGPFECFGYVLPPQVPEAAEAYFSKIHYPYFLCTIKQKYQLLYIYAL